MDPTFPLGRIAGVKIGLNWSWAIVFALIVWSLADGVFPDQNPGLSGGEYAGMAVVAAVLFFASLLLHELGHAVQARREGVEIEGITLWLFGGVAQFKDDFPSAGAEFRIAIAGPAVTALIASACLAVAAAAHCLRRVSEMRDLPCPLDLLDDEPPVVPSSANSASQALKRSSHSRTDARFAGLSRPRRTSPLAWSSVL